MFILVKTVVDHDSIEIVKRMLDKSGNININSKFIRNEKIIIAESLLSYKKK